MINLTTLIQHYIQLEVNAVIYRGKGILFAVVDAH